MIIYGGRGLLLGQNLFFFFFSFLNFQPHSTFNPTLFDYSAYDIPNMPRLSKDLDIYKDEILDLLHSQRWKQ